MERSIPIIGIVGAIGSGKSLVANSLIDQNARVIDLDLLCLDLSKKGKRLWKEVVLTFGSGFLDQKGE